MHIFRPVSYTQMTRLCLAVGTLSGIAALSLGGQSAWADPCTTPSNGPTGSGAATFVYQCAGAYAGDWTNKYYVYNPATDAQTALYAPDYSYDCTTGTWTQAEWDYDAGSGAYIENRVAATAPPDLPTNCPVPATTAVTTPNSSSQSSSSGSASAQSTAPAPAPTPTQTASTAPVNSKSSPTPTQPSATTDPVTTNPSENDAPSAPGASMDNTVSSQSQSGNATVDHNGTAGNATTGDATTTVDVANLVETVGNAFGSGTTTFTTNVDGNVNGDLVFDPSVIASGASGSDPGSEPTALLSSTSSNAAIDNDISASASTGNATVANNGTAGNATTGDAETAVNLINIINSAIAAGQSFVGTININGDLNGNILIPQSVIDQLLGSNGGGTTTDPNTAVASTTNESISNNITAGATSGDATVTNNRSAGNATSGAASTNVTIMNLTGSSIVGKNVLLVFVNVLGQWVGMIVNAPAGATSAEFGGGIESTTPTSASTLSTTPSSTTPRSSVVEADAQLSITNNVDANAQSGNALVTGNGTAGNATSGTAETAVNILNMENSVLSLANWFGILFINVFGTWNGDFGIAPDPAAPVTSSSTSTNSPTQTSNLEPASYSSPRRFATFIANDSNSNITDNNNAPGSNPGTSSDTAILGDATITPTASRLNTSSLPTQDNGTHANYAVSALGLSLALLLLAVSERDRLLRRKP